MTTTSLRTPLLLGLLACCGLVLLTTPAVSAFVPQPLLAGQQQQQQQPVVAMMTRLANSQRLSEIDEMCIENVAEYCLKAENALSDSAGCDVEEYQALVNQLRDQRALLAGHLDYVDSLLTKLQGNGDGTTAAAGSVAEETYFAG